MILLLGLPIALILAWAFELTPDGVRREAEVGADESIARSSGRRINTLTIAGLVVAVGILAADRFLMHESAPDAGDPTGSDEITMTSAEDKSIAVLPFVSMSASEEDEYFADGLSEELLNVLARNERLQVAGRTSSFYYKGRNEDLREIAEALGVAHVLEGSVRRSGDRLRVTAQLIQAETGFHLWSDTYDRGKGDVFDIQDEIAQNVAEALQAKILGETSSVASAAAPGEQNSEAHSLALVAQAALAKRGLQKVRQARDLFAQASELAPEDPRYLAGYAQAVAVQYWNFRDIGPDEAIYETSNAIETALELETPSADTLAIAGLVEELRALTASDPEAKGKALEYYQQALELQPNNILALQWIASIYLDVNEPELARESFERVVDLDPLNLLALTGLANAYRRLGLLEESRQHLYRVQHLFPDLGMAKRYLSGSELVAGRLDKATVWGRLAIDLDPNPLEIYSVVLAYTAFGWTDEALETAERFRQSTDGADISRLVQAWLDRDFQGVVDEASKVFAQSGESEFAVLSAWANAIDGNCAATVGTLERQYPSLRGEVIEYIDRSDLLNAVLLAHCYADTGAGSEASRITGMLLDSELLSDDTVALSQYMALTRIATLAIDGQTDVAISELGEIDVEAMPLAISPIALPVDELPVFESLYDEPTFVAYARQERYKLAEQARMLAAGETLAEIRADVEASGFTFND